MDIRFDGGACRGYGFSLPVATFTRGSFGISIILLYNTIEVFSMKMLTTQLSGLLDRIATNNEDAIEETARLLAQATVGEGRIIIAAFGEYEAVSTVATKGHNAFQRAVMFEDGLAIDAADRVWILTPSVDDERAVNLARQLDDAFIPFAVVAPEKEDGQELYNEAMTFISTGLLKGLLPGENGERIVEPHGLSALFIYEAVKLAYDDMLVDFA